MAKLRADITYNRRIEQESKLATTKSLQENIHVNIHNNESEKINDIILDDEILLDIESDLIEDDSEDQNDENLEIDLTSKFNDHLSEWLDILQQEINSENELDDDLYDFDIDIENIEHPAQNTNAKWKLENIFKCDLNCPF
jgi:hypothetical protein